jgi:Cu/Zn superoxide dismutase
MRKTLVATLCILASPALHSCRKSPAESIGARDRASAAWVEQALPARATNPAPVAEVTALASSSSEVRARAGGREANAELHGLGGERLRGRALLKERAGGVEIALQVENATPGTPVVVLRDTGSCSRATPKGAGPAALAKPGQHAPHEANAQLGALLIDQSGEGKLHVNLPTANLKQEEPGTLLGKALLIYPQERIGTGRSQGQTVIACAQILADP